MMTGAEYRESLKDGRATYFDGARVDDMESSPPLAAAVHAVAAGYDKYYSAAPGARNPLMTAPRSSDELRDRIPLLHEVDIVLNVTYQSLMTLLTAAPKIKDAAPDCYERLNVYVDEALERDLRVTECITDAKGNRSRPPSKQVDPDMYTHVVRRTSDGIVLRGAKLHISGASFGHDLIVMPTKNMKSGEEDYAVACAVPVNAPGVRIVNVTYHPRSEDTRHFPISSTNSMPDGFVIFDDVFVPYERVFLDGQCTFAAVFAHSLGLWERLGGMSAMVRQADQMVGLASLVAEANGLAGISHIREKIDEMAIHATMLRAGLEAALTHAHITPEGYCFPNELFTNATKYTGAVAFNTMVRHLHDIAGGSIITMPTIGDLENPEVSADLKKYVSTGPEVDAEYRMRLFHTIRDMTADSYGGWNLVTAIQAGGGLYAQRLVTRKHYDFERARQEARELAGVPVQNP
jgi:4-hydroxybutyryl-CoA dehydratase/vinylacetyl-CoA-Delta-isomerase